MLGSSLGAGRVTSPRSTAIPVEVTGTYHTIVLVAEDVRGSIARIAAILAEDGINIATLRLTRKERGGDAFMVIEVDEPPDEEVRDDIRALAWVRWAFAPRQSERLTCTAPSPTPSATPSGAGSRSPQSRSTPSRAIRADGRRHPDALGRALDVMRGAVDAGLDRRSPLGIGLVGGDAAKLRAGPAGPLAGTPFRDVLARALAVQEVNAAMGVIVAAPTAGGAGVLPAVLTGLADARGFRDDRSSTRWRRRA